MKRPFPVVPPLLMLLLLLAAPAAEAGVALGADCAGGTTVHVQLHVFTDYGEEDLLGVVVQRSWVGACGLELMVTAEPFPFPPLLTGTIYSFDDHVPQAGRYFMYRAYVMTASGELRPATGLGDPLPYDYAACGEAVATRGYLLGIAAASPSVYVEFAPCQDDCWFMEFGWYPAYLDVSGLDPAMYEPYLGQPIAVDIYGDIYVDGMPGASGIYDITRIEPSPDGVCGPVPARRTSWGALKHSYR
jgi:hypothetical protein